jgi:hypothetical protein
VTVVLDANERTDSGLTLLIEETLRDTKKCCVIAINQGILVDLFESAPKAGWSQQGKKQLLKPFVYVQPDLVSKHRLTDSKDQVRIFDLNHRNNLGPDVTGKALQLLVGLSRPCDQCEHGTCAAEINGERLADKRVHDRVVSLLDTVSRSGFHATMRDVQAFFAFLLYGQIECPHDGYARPTKYWTNVFEAGEGELFTQLRKYDPSLNPRPLLDDLLWRHADSPNDWFLGTDEANQPGSLLDRNAWFVDRKRRALFEHKEGSSLLSNAGSAVGRVFDGLVRGKADSTSGLVRLLNRFFDRDDERDDALFLWVSHRYDARSSRYAAAGVSVPTQELEVVIPTLPAYMVEAFPDYRPNHVILRKRDEEHVAGLRVDAPLLQALLAAEEGMPSNFRRGEPEARIAAFYNSLAQGAWDRTKGSVLKIRLVDIDTGRNVQLRVSVESREYQEQ